MVVRQQALCTPQNIQLNEKISNSQSNSRSINSNSTEKKNRRIGKQERTMIRSYEQQLKRWREMNFKSSRRKKRKQKSLVNTSTLPLSDTRKKKESIGLNNNNRPINSEKNCRNSTKKRLKGREMQNWPRSKLAQSITRLLKGSVRSTSEMNCLP
jgi:Na+-translocating ferredoxin:NAD+ oxidoreductase RnfC subunit